MVSSEIFRAYDIRGRFGIDIDPETFYRIGAANARVVKDDAVYVGNDVRTSSSAMSRAFIAGVLSAGVDVIDCGTTSFGACMYGGVMSDAGSIAYITASHLPAEWNGVKFAYGDGVGMGSEVIYGIRDLVLGGELECARWDKVGNLTTEDPNDAYITYLHERFPGLTSRMAVDCGGGSTTVTVPEMLERMGLDCGKVFWETDPLFSGRPSEPNRETLSKLREMVTSEGYDFGVAFDGDGDRGVVVDPKGRVLDADTLGVIIGRELIRRYHAENPDGPAPVVLANVESGKVIEAVLEPLGADVIRIRVGHTFLTAEAKERNALMGVERSGHMVFPPYFLFDDAVIIPLILADVLDGKLDEIVDGLPPFFKRFNDFDCADAVKFDVIESLKEAFSSEYENVNTMDGVRVDLPDGWCLVRASNTSPVIRLTAEAMSDDRAEELGETFSARVQAMIDDAGGDTA